MEDVAAWIEANARKRTKGEKPLSYHQLRAILQRFGFSIDPPVKMFLDVRDATGLRVERIKKEGLQGFRPYHTDYIAGLRKRLHLTAEDGVDSERFYGRVDVEHAFSDLVEMRLDVIKRLART